MRQRTGGARVGGVAGDAAEVDGGGGAVAAEGASEDARPPEPPAPGAGGRAGAGGRFAARLVRGARAALHLDRVHRRRHEPAAGAAVRRSGDDGGVHGDAARAPRRARPADVTRSSRRDARPSSFVLDFLFRLRDSPCRLGGSPSLGLFTSAKCTKPRLGFPSQPSSQPSPSMPRPPVLVVTDQLSVAHQPSVGPLTSARRSGSVRVRASERHRSAGRRERHLTARTSPPSFQPKARILGVDAKEVTSGQRTHPPAVAARRPTGNA